ncbi:MAG: flagellar biosynthesis anti-sigma factor FlgM [Spirochaetia bacterium]
MTIDRLGPIDPISNYNKTSKTSRQVRKDQTDSISLSDEAKNKAEVYQAVEAARSAPEVRLDRVEEVRQKLEDPNYINDTIIEKTAERIMDAFDI